MAAQGNYRVYKITEYRDGCVYNTKLVKEVWLPLLPRSVEEENELAIAHGGDFLSSPDPKTGYKF